MIACRLLGLNIVEIRKE